MGNQKQRLNNTSLDNLISNLRGEVGDILFTWLLLLRLSKNYKYLQSPNIQQDLENPEMNLLAILIDKIENDIVARLSELAELKIGQLNYYFVKEKLIGRCNLQPDLDKYRKFIDNNRFGDKRNQFISHKQLPEQWTDHRTINISIPILGKCIALAVQFMIKIDKVFLGPSAIYLWHEVLKKKAHPMVPLPVNFLLLPYMKLSMESRKTIIAREMEAGYEIWDHVNLKVNGVERDVIICKKWGAILTTPNSYFLIDDYPILELTEIRFPD